MFDEVPKSFEAHDRNRNQQQHRGISQSEHLEPQTAFRVLIVTKLAFLKDVIGFESLFMCHVCRLVEEREQNSETCVYSKK